MRRVMAPGEPRRNQYDQRQQQQHQQQARRHWNMIQVLSQSLKLRHLLWLALVIAIIGILVFGLPFFKEELLLQVQCHLNESHLAYENLRLMAEVKRARQETEDMRERVQLSQSDADSEHSRANRSFWGGVWMTVVVIFTIELAVGISIWYMCCRCLARVRAPQQPMNRLQWHH